jgi:tRNA1Val (adenine37-N6)-methyltransferase
MAFRFKQFIVEDDQSTMPVGTDAMLLGAWADPADSGTILDIGCGCGVLALMMAQKSNALIDAIDIDEKSVLQAGNNFRMSPWKTRLKAYSVTLQLFPSIVGKHYDYIISNPPFFAASLKSPSETRNRARHDTDLTLVRLLCEIKKLLKPDGKFAVILPEQTHAEFNRLAGLHGFYPERSLSIYSKANKPCLRILLEFGTSGSVALKEDNLVICNLNGQFTPEYLRLTEEFHYF